VAPADVEDHKAAGQVPLDQELASLIVERAPALAVSVLEGCFRSLIASMPSALRGLALGALMGTGLAYVYNALPSCTGVHGSDTLIMGATRIYPYLIGVNAAGGAAIALWMGLKTRLRRSILKDRILSDLLGSVADRMYVFLGTNKPSRDEQYQLLAGIQARIEKARPDLTGTIEHMTSGRSHLCRMTSRFSLRILDMASRIPEMILLNISLAPGQGPPAASQARQRALSSLEKTVEGAFDSALANSIAINAGVMAILEALPFFLLISSFLTDRL